MTLIFRCDGCGRVEGNNDLTAGSFNSVKLSGGLVTGRTDLTELHLCSECARQLRDAVQAVVKSYRR